MTHRIRAALFLPRWLMAVAYEREKLPRTWMDKQGEAKIRVEGSAPLMLASLSLPLACYNAPQTSPPTKCVRKAPKTGACANKLLHFLFTTHNSGKAAVSTRGKNACLFNSTTKNHPSPITNIINQIIYLPPTKSPCTKVSAKQNSNSNQSHSALPSFFLVLLHPSYTPTPCGRLHTKHIGAETEARSTYVCAARIMVLTRFFVATDYAKD